MITKRIFQVLMIAAMMTISATVVEAQRINQEALQKFSRGDKVNPTGTLAKTPDNNAAMEPAAAQIAGQGEWFATSVPPKKTALVGSWLDTVTVAGGPTFKSLSTYTEGGGWVFTDQGDVITESDFPHVFSAGQGGWVHQGGRTFIQSALQLLSDLKGDLLGISKVSQILTLHDSGDAYRVIWKADFIDPDGNLIFSSEGTLEGKRIKVEPLP